MELRCYIVIELKAGKFKRFWIDEFGLQTLFKNGHRGGKSIDLIAYLDEFVQTITKRTILILDNAPIHRSKIFKAKMKLWEKEDMYVYFLPPYSPELNKIEILWRFVKYQWLPFDAFTNFKNLKQRLDEVLKNIGTKCSIKFY